MLNANLDHSLTIIAALIGADNQKDTADRLPDDVRKVLMEAIKSMVLTAKDFKDLNEDSVLLSDDNERLKKYNRWLDWRLKRRDKRFVELMEEKGIFAARKARSHTRLLTPAQSIDNTEPTTKLPEPHFCEVFCHA